MPAPLQELPGLVAEALERQAVPRRKGPRRSLALAQLVARAARRPELACEPVQCASTRTKPVIATPRMPAPMNAAVARSAVSWPVAVDGRRR